MKKYLRKLLTGLSGELRSEDILNSDRALMLLGRIATETLSGLDRIGSLADVEFGVYSQWGEDGIIEWLIRKLPISSPTYVEFGVEDYSESNTRFLLKNRNWRGLVVDASPEHIQSIRKEEIYWRHDLTAIPSFVNRDNINDTISDGGVSGRIGLLSIDIDGNDYWIWEALDVVDPDIVVCEYNAVFGDVYPITIPYSENFNRTCAHHSNLYAGAGIKALNFLASRKGYRLVGSNGAGNNAFFLREDLFPIVDVLVKDKKARPSLFRESRDGDGKLTFAGGLNRLELIKEMPVFNVETGEKCLLGSYPDLYSDLWLEVLA